MSASEASPYVSANEIALAISETLQRCETEIANLEASLLVWAPNSSMKSDVLIEELQRIDLLSQLQADALALSNVLKVFAGGSVDLDIDICDRQSLNDICKLGEVRKLFDKQPQILTNSSIDETALDNSDLILFGN